MNTQLTIPIKYRSDDATTPQFNMGAAGYDLFAVESYELKPMERHLFLTDISLSIPQGFYGRIAPRSGMAYISGIDVMAGVIDSSYRGNIGVLLINLGDTVVYIQKGDKIAQLIIEPYAQVQFMTVAELTESARGEGGFGSTGK